MENKNIRHDLLNDEEWLYRKYVIEKLSTIKIGKICNCKNDTVGRYLKKFNINIRPFNKSQNLNANWDLLNNKEWLYQKYIEEKLSTLKIANFCNCSNITVGKKLRKFGIKIRSLNKANNPNVRWDFLNDEEWLYIKYIEEKLSTYKIAKICNCSNVFVGEQLNKFNIEMRDHKGENNPMWKGGISKQNYCFKFNKKFKEAIRDKFNRKCFLCEKPEEDNNCKLHVHHVDYNKGQGCGYSWSLIPLCTSCHMKTNRNRYYWFNLLNNYWLYSYKEYLDDSLQIDLK